MSDLENRIRKSLIKIKTNPGIDTKTDLDAHLIKDLYQQGMIEGNLSRELSRSEPYLSKLRITLSGEQYLEKLSKSSLKFQLWRNSKKTIWGIIALIAVPLLVGVILFEYAEYRKSSNKLLHPTATVASE